MKLENVRAGMRVHLVSHDDIDSSENLEIGYKGTVQVAHSEGQEQTVFVEWDDFIVMEGWWVRHQDIAPLFPRVLENK